MLALITGLVAGAGHVFSGPDHWVAVAPLSVDRPLKSLQIGFRWGLGHGLGVLGLGFLGIWLRDTIALESVSSVAEIIVGGVLILTGIWAVVRSRTIILHSHPHGHSASDDHSHLHIHVGETEHSSDAASHRHGHAAFGLGALHGVAGGSHLWGLLPALALERWAAVVYLAAFVVSSTAAMMAFSFGAARLAKAGSGSKVRMGLRGVGTVAIGVGVYWLTAAIGAS